MLLPTRIAPSVAMLSQVRTPIPEAWSVTVCPGYGEWIGRGRKYRLASSREQDHVAMDDGDLSNLTLFPPQKPLWPL